MCQYLLQHVPYIPLNSHMQFPLIPLHPLRHQKRHNNLSPHKIIDHYPRQPYIKTLLLHAIQSILTGIKLSHLYQRIYVHIVMHFILYHCMIKIIPFRT